MISIFSISRRRRIDRATAQLPDALVIMKGALQAGLSIRQAMEMAAAEIGDPLGTELAKAVNCMKLGGTVDEALGILHGNVPSEDVELFVRAVEILRRSGGNMGECFGKLIATIERRCDVQKRVRSLTAQGIMQAVTLLALPWFMAAVLSIVAPDFISPLLDTRLGNFIIAMAILLELAGALWLRKIVVIRV